MISSLQSVPAQPASGAAGSGSTVSTGSTGTGGFAEALRGALGEVQQLQREASQAVERLATNQTDDMIGVMTAMEKSSVAFKTLLAIRGKLMDAYEEIRNMPI